RLAVDAGESDSAVYLVPGKLCLIDLRRDGIERGGQESVVQPVIALCERTENIPAQPEIDGQAAAELDIVLHPGSVVTPTVVGPRDVVDSAGCRRAQQHGSDGVAAHRIGGEIVGAREGLVEGK